MGGAVNVRFARMCATSILGLGLAGCSEFVIEEGDPVPPAVPPGISQGPGGVPPDWASCTSGYAGRYFNLTDDHPDVERTGEIDLSTVDWWDPDRLSFERFEPSLELGGSWWPVDEDLASDPHYFAVVWYAWIRVTDGGDTSVVAGAATDLQVRVGEEVVIETVGRETLESQTWQVPLDSGVEPVEIRFAHRIGAEDGLRFRFASQDVQLCYPAWE